MCPRGSFRGVGRMNYKQSPFFWKVPKKVLKQSVFTIIILKFKDKEEALLEKAKKRVVALRFFFFFFFYKSIFSNFNNDASGKL